MYNYDGNQKQKHEEEAAAAEAEAEAKAAEGFPKGEEEEAPVHEELWTIISNIKIIF